MEPYKAKMVRPLPTVGAAERGRLLEAAGYNPSLLPADRILFDLLSDSGTGALSDRQAGALMQGDEAYAGSRDYYQLGDAVSSLFGFHHVLPVHQGRGAENLLMRTLLSAGDTVAANAPFETTRAHVEAQGARILDAGPSDPSAAWADFDLELLQKGGTIKLLVAGLTCNALGGRPVRSSNLAAIRDFCREYGVPLIVDGSRIFEQAALLKAQEPGMANLSAREIARSIADLAHVFYMSGKKDGLNKAGGFIAVRDPALHARLAAAGLIFEGMPSYGGMAGRDMAALAIGLREGVDDRYLTHRLNQIARLADKLRAAEVPFRDPPGGHAIMLDATAFLGGELPSCAVSAALYRAGGVRGAAMDARWVRLALPRRVYGDDHLDAIADVAIHVWNHRAAIRHLETTHAVEGRARFSTRFEPTSSGADLPACVLAPHSPFVNEIIELMPDPGRHGRQAALDRAFGNLYSLESSAVEIDLFTDSGTAAMSTAQWGRAWMGDDASLGSASLRRLQETIHEVYGMPHALATHQGRGAEAVLFDTLVKPGQAVVVNMHFFSTVQHLRRVGAVIVDAIDRVAYDIGSTQPFKGNLDLDRLDQALAAGNVAIVTISLTVNDAGGQPVSSANLAGVAERCKAAGVPLWLDATRACENAWFVRRDERPDLAIPEILREQVALADGIWVSAKKDCLVNIGGFVATKHQAIAESLLDRLILYEGMPGNGGLAGRDLEFIAQGIREMTDEAYLDHRIGQIKKLHDHLSRAGVPVLAPPGGHAVLLDAEAFLPHLGRDEWPGHALASALFLEAGVRAMPIRTQLGPSGKREMVRLTLPRRVYSQSQLTAVAEAIIRLHRDCKAIPGIRMVDRPEAFPYITGKFERLPVAVEVI